MRESAVFDRVGNRWVVRRRWTPRWTRVDVGKRFRRARRRNSAQPDRSRPWWDVIDIPFDAVDDVRGAEIQREVVGWRASRDAITTLRHEIELGLVSPVPSFEPP
jgi:hypothetical protein